MSIKLEPDPAKIFTITWTNLPAIYTNGYRIHATQNLADGWQIVGSSTSNMKAVTYTTRTGPTTSFYRLTPLVGDGGSPVYILQWVKGDPQIVTWEPPVEDLDPDPDPVIDLMFTPTDDAYLQAGTRFNDQHLKVEAGSRVAYLRFVVEGVAGSVATKLRLVEKGDTGSGTLRVWLGSHSNWSETNLQSSNAPLKASLIGAFEGAITTGQQIEINLEPVANGVHTFIVEQDAGGNDVWFGSKESQSPPALRILSTP